MLKTINIKKVNIDNDEIISVDNIKAKAGEKVKIMLKEVKGFKLVSNEFYDNNQDNQGNDQKNTKKNSKTTIIDELIDSLKDDYDVDGKKNSNFCNQDLDDESNDKNGNKIKSEYEIVMNCDDSDYIIYYKKSF